nr:hypothetical protein [Tanacetum cinerariifolium]
VVSRVSHLQSSRLEVEEDPRLGEREEVVGIDVEMDDIEPERPCARSRWGCDSVLAEGSARGGAEGALKMYCSSTDAITKDMA